MIAPASVSKRTGGRPSPLSVPDGGWTWAAVAQLEPGDYIIQTVSADETVLPDESAPTDLRAVAGVIAESTRAAARVADGYDHLIAAQQRVIDKLAPMAEESGGGLGGLLSAAAPHLLPMLQAMAAAKAPAGSGQ